MVSIIWVCLFYVQDGLVRERLGVGGQSRGSYSFFLVFDWSCEVRDGGFKLGKVSVVIRDVLGGGKCSLFYVIFIGWLELVNQVRGVRGRFWEEERCVFSGIGVMLVGIYIISLEKLTLQGGRSRGEEVGRLVVIEGEVQCRRYGRVWGVGFVQSQVKYVIFFGFLFFRFFSS